MADRPLLLFPAPEPASKSKLGGGGGNVHKPSHGTQVHRVAPQLQQLQKALNNKAIAVQSSSSGIEPELALVIETIGSVDGFLSAVNKIDGLEWLGEYEQDEIIPDEYFYDVKHEEKKLSGRLFFLFTNQAAMAQLLNLWEKFEQNPGKKFGEIFDYGYASIGRLFEQVKTIRLWDVQDRLLETGVLDAWREDLEHDGERPIRFEVELWFRNSHEVRQTQQKYIANLVQQYEGNVLSQCILEDISYHALLAELPANAIQDLLDDQTTELVKCDNIMFFRPVGQISVGEQPDEDTTEIETFQESPLPAGNPVIAVFDGLPLANHELLAERLIIDDPDDWSSDYSASERIHGTTMSALVVHGDLNDSGHTLETPVYIRPIMKPDPNDWHNPRRECIPRDVLAVDLIHRAVKRILEGDGDEEAIAPTVKIINLSIGDPSRQFDVVMSPLARLLDWLSSKYNVLFFVSTGNQLAPVSLGINRSEFEALSADDLEKIIIEALHEDARNRRLLSPAESINAITVGAVHLDTSEVVHTANRFDPFEKILPSPVSSVGSGYRRSVKPDIVFPGGKLWYEKPFLDSQPVLLTVTNTTVAPGNKVAYPGKVEGELAAIAYTRGTSNSTALISRAAGLCHDSLVQIINEQAPPEIDADTYIATLLKAMVVHGCSWNDFGQELSDILRHSKVGEQVEHFARSIYSHNSAITNEINRQYNKILHRWLGYGMPEIDRVLDCTEQRASLLGFGQLPDGEAHIFQLPLPPSLASRPEWRRLTVTLAWLSPVSPNTQKYRTASLWFEINNSIASSRTDVDYHAVRRGTVQHEVFEGDSAEPFVDGDTVEIKVNCRSDAAKIAEPIGYGLVVSLEVSDGVDIAVYDEIKTRIAPLVQIQQATGGNE